MEKGTKKPSVCNCLNLRRASTAITKIYDEKLTPSGLSVSQYSLLRHILLLGPVSVSDLAVKIKLDRTTLVRNLKPLESAGFIADLSQKNARNRQLQLTEKGIEKYKEADQLWNDAQAFVEQNLGKENIEVLTSLLSKIENLET